jgi:hypothetical protein
VERFRCDHMWLHFEFNSSLRAFIKHNLEKRHTIPIPTQKRKRKLGDKKSRRRQTRENSPDADAGEGRRERASPDDTDSTTRYDDDDTDTTCARKMHIHAHDRDATKCGERMNYPSIHAERDDSCAPPSPSISGYPPEASGTEEEMGYTRCDEMHERM